MQVFRFTRSHRQSFHVGARLVALVALCAGMAMRPAAAKTNWSAEELSILRGGTAIVSVTPADGPADGHVRAAIDVPAPKSAVWAVLFDCAGAPAFMPSLQSCTVMQQGPGGAWDVREHQVQWTSFLPNVRSVFRSEYVTEESIVFSRVEGDLSYLEGAWRLEPLAGGKATRIHYDARVGFSSLVPGFLVRNALLKDIPQFLGVIRQEVLRRGPGTAGR